METVMSLMGLMAVLLSLPILVSFLYYKSRKGEILYINPDKTRDARFFGKSFASLIERGIREQTGARTIRLSREERYLDAEAFLKLQKETAEELVIAQVPELVWPEQIKVCEKEIYAAGDMKTTETGKRSLRAAYSKGDMAVGRNTEVVRWIDAEGTLAVYENCDLGISASSGTAMSVGGGCRFRRLYAPELRIGQYPGEVVDERAGKDVRIYRMPVCMEKERNKRSITSEMINENGVVEYSILSWQNLNITEGIIVQGDVRSHRGVRLCANAVVCGNVFAESDIYLEKNAVVLGSIFSQESIYFEEEAAAGQQGHICSVIARGRIVFEGKNAVFGYVNCEGGGRVREEREAKERALSYFPRPVRDSYLGFADLNEYEHVDQQGFRFRKELVDAEIPCGARVIPKSMFYCCEGLEEILLPDTLEEIGDHAFAGCMKLKKINLGHLKHLRRIGISAFENCGSLEKVELPASVEALGGAVFSGCAALKCVQFQKGTLLREIPDHAFCGCRELELAALPPSVETIGVSSFRECRRVPVLRRAGAFEEGVEEDEI